jgi:uncharacterized membrane protein
VLAQKNLLVDTMRIVVGDMQWFLAFMALTCLGFAFAFFSLFRQDRDSPDFTNFWHACASMVSYLLVCALRPERACVPGVHLSSLQQLLQHALLADRNAVWFASD